MSWLLSLVVCVVVSVIVQMVLYHNSAVGDMDIEWDEKSQGYIGTMHVSKDIDYSKKEKLILKINHK